MSSISWPSGLIFEPPPEIVVITCCIVVFLLFAYTMARAIFRQKYWQPTKRIHGDRALFFSFTLLALVVYALAFLQHESRGWRSLHDYNIITVIAGTLGIVAVVLKAFLDVNEEQRNFND